MSHEGSLTECVDFGEIAAKRQDLVISDSVSVAFRSNPGYPYGPWLW